MQLNHENSKFNKRNFPITILCDSIQSPYNIGGLFRISEAFGVEKLIFNNIDNLDFGRRMKRSARSTEKKVTHGFSNDLVSTLVDLKNRNYQIIGLEITKDSKSLNSYSLDTSKPAALIIGNENYGISENFLTHCDTILHIDMFGTNSSMNVIQATSIALYEITNQLLATNK